MLNVSSLHLEVMLGLLANLESEANEGSYKLLPFDEKP